MDGRAPESAGEGCGAHVVLAPCAPCCAACPCRLHGVRGLRRPAACGAWAAGCGWPGRVFSVRFESRRRTACPACVAPSDACAAAAPRPSLLRESTGAAVACGSATGRGLRACNGSEPRARLPQRFLVHTSRDVRPLAGAHRSTVPASVPVEGAASCLSTLGVALRSTVASALFFAAAPAAPEGARAAAASAQTAAARSEGRERSWAARLRSPKVIKRPGSLDCSVGPRLAIQRPGG